MSDRTVAVVEAELVEQLEQLGFSAYESRTLVELTRLGTGTARDVADADGVPRTRVYDAVDSLHDRGLVDIQHTTPKKFTAVSRESVVRMLNTERENRITEVAELLEELGPAEPQTEQMGVWTVTGRPAVAERVLQFVDDADDRIVYLTVDELLTDAHLAHLQAADERGVDIHLAGISASVRGRIQEAVPSAETFDTLWEWAETPAGSLLVTDENAALVSVRVDGTGPEAIEETAIWGSGERNSLVVVLRAIFTWRLGNDDLTPESPS